MKPINALAGVYIRNVWKGFLILALLLGIMGLGAFYSSDYIETTYELFFFQNPLCFKAFLGIIVAFFLYGIVKIHTLHVTYHFSLQVQRLHISPWKDMLISICVLMAFFAAFAFIEAILFLYGYTYFQDDILALFGRQESFYMVMQSGSYTALFLPLSLKGALRFILIVSYLAALQNVFGRGFRYLRKAFIITALLVVGLVLCVLFFWSINEIIMMTDVMYQGPYSFYMTLYYDEWYFVYFIVFIVSLLIVHQRLAKKKKI